MRGRSWRTNYPLVQATCHKLGQGDRVRSLHELSKSANVSDVSEEKGRIEAFLDFLCTWTNKEQMFFILDLFQITALTKPLNIWHAFPRT
jgi:hypothetical protein